MRNTLVALAVAFIALPALAKERIQVPCTVGGRVVVTAGVNSTTRVLQSFPSCTITVYNTGTLTLSTIYSTNTGTSLANPFTANTSGFGYFYAANGTYDVQISGGGLASPYTFGAVIAFDVADYVVAADPPGLSVQYNLNGALTGDANLTWNPTTQAMGIAGIANTPSIFVATGQIVSANDTYQGYTTASDGVVARGALILQNQNQTRGGYMVFPPITYNPYDGAPCFDQWGNPVNQPLPLTGYTFGQFDAVIWNAPSPAMPANGSCGPPLPVNETYMGIQAGTGLNTNSYFLARGGLATDNSAFNSVQSLLGGMYARLSLVTDQALLLERHASSATLPQQLSLCVISSDPAPPPGCYGALAYQGGSVFYYWNNATLDWHTVDFSGGGGGGGCPGITTGYVLFSNGSNCIGSGNFTWDNTNQLLTVAGVDNAHAAIATSAGYIQTTGGFLTTNTQGTSVQTSGGFTANNTLAAIVPLTIKAAAAQSANLADFKNNAGTVIAHVGSAGTLFFPGAELGAGGLVLDSITGMAQCLQIDTDGIVSGSGATCGAGGGGVPGAPSTSIQYNSGGTFAGDANYERTAPGGITTITLTGQGANFADAATTVPLLVRGFMSQSADLQRWQSSTPATLASIGSLGTFFGPGAALTITNAATQGLIVKGASAQSANLAEFQNNSATVLASIGSLGTVTGPGFVGTNTSTNVTFQNTDSTKFNVTGAGILTIANLTINTLTGSTQCVQVNTSGVVSGTGSACGGAGSTPGGPAGAIQYNNTSFGGSATAVIDASGNMTLGAGTSTSSTSQLQIVGTGANAGLNITATTAKSASIQSVGGVTLNLATADTRGISITQASAPSVNAMQVVNSAAATIWSVGSLGTTTAPGYVGTNTSTNNTFQNSGGSPTFTVNGNGSITDTQETITIANLANVGLTVTGASSQSAHLIDMKSSGGTVLSYFAGAGGLVIQEDGTNPILTTKANGNFLFATNTLGQAVFYDATGSGGINGVGDRIFLDASIGKITVQTTSGDMMAFRTNAGSVVASVSGAGAATLAGLTLSNIASGTQCLHVNSSGVVSGVGADCGSGGGGGVTSLNSQTGAMTLQGTSNQVSVGTVGTTITLTTPQSIGTGNSPTFSGLTLSSISGSTQCLHVNSSGVLAGTGSDCGSGGGGGADTQLSNLSSVAVNAKIAPGSDNSISLGDSTHRWSTTYSAEFDAPASSGSVQICFMNGNNVGCTNGAGVTQTGMSATGIADVPIKSTTGTRYVCVDTAGNLTSSSVGCSGT